ncbi:MAG: hypothetical protein CMJ18_06715 [Phycisphaeraceae bacterium]|nr:hypothetical protein [Phycisphaeraceae bacterium]
MIMVQRPPQDIMASLPKHYRSDAPHEWTKSGVNAAETSPTGREIGQFVGAIIGGDLGSSGGCRSGNPNFWAWASTTHRLCTSPCMSYRKVR